MRKLPHLGCLPHRIDGLGTEWVHRACMHVQGDETAISVYNRTHLIVNNNHTRTKIDDVNVERAVFFKLNKKI